MKSTAQVWTLALAVSAMASTFGISTQAFAHSTKNGKTLCNFAPVNNRKIPVGANGSGGIDEAAFNRAIDRLKQIYTPIVKARGKKLNFKNLWKDSTVNSSAEQHGSEWVVNAYGGLARHPLMTEDGMMMVFCHEMGHHLGGAPLYSSIFGSNWASVEGQSD